MTDDEIKRYKEIIRHAVAKCDEWFINNPDYFYNKAKLIKKRCEAWEKEAARLNPTQQLNFRDPDSGIWYPDATKHFAKRKEPSLIDPIFACVGKPVTEWNPIKCCNEDRIEILIPSNKDDALLTYVAALLILHDGAAIQGKGLKLITENIWTKEQSPVLWASKFIDLRYFTNDRSVFIEAALRHVEADLAQTPAEKEQNATPAKIINIENFKGILGDVQAKNVQTGNHASIHKQTVTAEKKKGILRRIPYWIYILTAFLATLLTSLHYLGWLEPIKAFIGKILWPK